jgi:2'-5' RNA ligase
MAGAVRLFLAVWPPPPVVELIGSMPRPPVGGIRWTTPDQWHVTLRFFGPVPEDSIESVRAHCHRIDIDSVTMGSEGAVEAEMGPSTGRFGRRILHVPISGLDRLATATVAATASVGEPPDDRPFAGHLTLARSRARDGIDLRPLCGVPLAARWLVTELTLVASHLGAGPSGSAHYEVVERLAL